MNTRLMMVLLAAAAVLAVGCSSKSEPKLPGYQPYIAGQVTKNEFPRMLVEELPGQQTGGKCWVRVTEKTVFLQDEAGKVKVVDGNPSLEGQKVKVWSTAPILESYPCQGGADVVLLQSGGG